MCESAAYVLIVEPYFEAPFVTRKLVQAKAETDEPTKTTASITESNFLNLFILFLFIIYMFLYLSSQK